MQGRYVSGLSSSKAAIQCWTGERPMEMSISFPGDEDMSGDDKKQLIDFLVSDLLPRIGLVKEIA